MTDDLETFEEPESLRPLPGTAPAFLDGHTGAATPLTAPVLAAPVLTSARLRLRPPTLQDAKRIATALNDIDIAKMTSTIPHPYALGDALKWIDAINRSWLDRVSGKEEVRGGGFVIEPLADDRETGLGVIGGIGVREKTQRGSLELGYWIARDHWGHGYATEAAQTAVDWAFTAYDITGVRASYRPQNVASARVLAKCGFQPDGSELSHSVVAGQVLVNTCRLQRSVWRSLRRWGGGTPVLPTEVL